MRQKGLFDDQLDILLSYQEASEILGISVATLNNWVKANYISPVTNSSTKVKFSNDEIQAFRFRLLIGEIDKLNSRANKRNSKITFIPKERLKSKGDYEQVVSLISLVKQHGLDKQTALLLLALNILKTKGLILNNDLSKCTSVVELKFKNDNVKKVVENWASNCCISPLNEYTKILTASLISLEDILGIVYQSLLAEGHKAQNGSYYTPSSIVNSITEECKDKLTKQSLILDPSCGTGQFLISFSKYMANPSNIWGYDTDKIAVQIARVNLLLAFPSMDFFPNIYYENTLFTNADSKFDVVVTNPPWGYHFSQEELSKLSFLYPSVTSKEAFSYFILQGLRFLKTNGKLIFVLPEAILKIKMHHDIRKHILDTAAIININHLGNVFKNVLSPAIILSLEKRKINDNQIRIKNKSGHEYSISQSRFLANTYFAFDTAISNEDSQLISKIYRTPHITLVNNADWALGIVTGNNEAFLLNEKKSDNEGILKGSDIEHYYFAEPSLFITFEPKRFQQTAPEWKYRAVEKLIYKFISSRLAFAYDDKKTLTLNSANILIPQFDNYPTKQVLAFLNSSLFQYLFQKKFDTIKALRGDLEKLPFPLVDISISHQIIQKTDMLISSEVSKAEKAIIKEELDQLIFSILASTKRKQNI